MKNRSFIGSIGILLYVVLSLIDRFFVNGKPLTFFT